MKEYIFIDLDGTLTNSKEGITKSVQYALKHKGIIVEDLDSLSIHIGPPLRDGFKEFWGFKDEEMDEVIKKYREYYREKGIFENEVYPGIEKMLKTLKENGKTLIVATSKPEVFAKEVLEYFKLDKYFTNICGSAIDESRSAKGEVIRYALDKNHITNVDDVIMVGDRRHDVEGAHEHGMDCIGVLYGFGSREELENEGADHIAKSVEDLEKLLLNL